MSLKLEDTLAFPDAVTTRGLKHLEELMDMVKQGHRAVMLYIIQRTDNLAFDIAKNIDKKYYEKFLEARKSGVEVLVYQSNITLEEIFVEKKLSSNSIQLHNFDNFS